MEIEKSGEIYLLVAREPHLKKPVASSVKCGKDGRVDVAPINALKLLCFFSKISEQENFSTNKINIRRPCMRESGKEIFRGNLSIVLVNLTQQRSKLFAPMSASYVSSLD